MPTKQDFSKTLEEFRNYWENIIFGTRCECSWYFEVIWISLLEAGSRREVGSWTKVIENYWSCVIVIQSNCYNGLGEDLIIYSAIRWSQCDNGRDRNLNNCQSSMLFLWILIKKNGNNDLSELTWMQDLNI